MRESGPRIHPGEEINKSPGFLDRAREKIYDVVTEGRVPSEDYKSTRGVWGGKFVEKPDGKLVYDNRGVISTIDRKGDAVLRTFDDHLIKEPMKLYEKHPFLFFKFLFAGPKRHRGNTEEISENIERLGLREYYGKHPHGIEIKKPEIYKHGRILQDIFRSDVVGSDKLTNIDRFRALEGAAAYIASIHKEYGSIGELTPGNVIFQESDGSNVSRPVLNIPDIIYNKQKSFSENDKKATDILDFLLSLGVEEYRRSKDWGNVEKAFRIFVDKYSDKNVARAVKSLAARGRFVLPGEDRSKLPKPVKSLLSQHNKAHLGMTENVSKEMREKIIEACTEKEVKN